MDQKIFHSEPSNAPVSDEVNDVSRGPVGVPFSALQFDFEAYRKYVEDESLSEAQARELLGAVWFVITSFVDVGFGLSPIQQALDVNKLQMTLAADSRRAVSCRETFNKQQKKGVARPRRAARKRDS